MNNPVLILGTDANAYYMARCCYEAYKIKPYVIGTKELSFTKYTNILNVSYNKDMWSEEGFLKLLRDFAKDKDEKILLISTNETYSEFISKNKNELSKNYLFNLPNIDVIKSLTNKELFYKTYEKSSLKFPKTIYYDKNSKINLKDITYPVIVKPANVVSYNHLEFIGKNKIYKINNYEELNKTIDLVYHNGYKDKLIIQEFITGGDDYLFDAVCYVNSKGKAEFMSFAQIGLQERTKSMVGNAAVLINGLNLTKGNILAEVNILKEFLEQINYRGFAEIDMKYDQKDNTFKVLEINARQGRSSYYLNGLGKNLVKVLVDDLINNQEHEFQLLDKKVLLSFVPKGIIKKYVNNEKYKKEVFKLWKKVIKPMQAKCDKNILRYLMLRKRWLHYYKEYKDSYWQE